MDLAGLDQVDDDETFDGGPLAKYQDTAKAYIRLGHQMQSLRMARHFMERRIDLLIYTGQNDYALDVGVSAEAIDLRTFFLVNPDAPQAALNAEIRNWKYEEYLRANPDPNQITTGPPLRWILLPNERTDISPVHRVRLYPIPDQNYKAQYKARLNPYPLEKAADLVAWPQEYEHVLSLFAWNLLEGNLGEGKQGDIKELAMRAAAEVKLVSGSPADVRKAPQTMRMPRRGTAWRYNSPASVDPNTGAVID